MRMTRPGQRSLKVARSNPDSGIRPDELASWMLVASAAMNLDAVLNK